MNHKFIIQLGSYTKLAFDSAETAMRVYALLTEATPITSPYVYGSEYKRPESLEGIDFCREVDNVEIELKRVDASKFALHLTEDEFREKCRVQPTEVEGDARLVEVEAAPAQIEGPSADIAAEDEGIF